VEKERKRSHFKITCRTVIKRSVFKNLLYAFLLLLFQTTK